MASKKFIQALDLLESEKGIKKEIVLDALKEALEKSYKKNYGGPESIIRVEINEITGKIRLYEIKHVVDDVNDEDYELSLEEAQMINPKYQVGDDVVTEVDPEVFGRLAAIQTKQLLKQKIREAEKETLYNEYIDKKDDIINGTVDRVEERFAIINIGRTGALLPLKDAQLQQEAALQVIEHQMTVAETERLVETLLQQAPPAKPERKQKKTFIVKDIRIFLNTLTRGLRLMELAGIHADCHQEEKEDNIILTIEIPKQSDPSHHS